MELPVKRSFHFEDKIKNPILKKIYKQRHLFLMLIIPLCIYILFDYVPLTKIYWAFTNYGEVRLDKVEFIGLANFKRLFGTQSFLRALKNTVIISLYKILYGFPIPIIIAILLNEIRNKAYKRTVQTIIYFPHFLSWVVIGSIFYMLLAPQNSINAQIAYLLGKEPIYWFASRKYIRSLLVVSDIWQGAGYGAIVYLAAISGIDINLYEAAIVDGASKFRQIWHITLPSIRSTIVIMLIFRLGRILNVFQQVLVMVKPIVYEMGDVIQTYAYRTGISEMKIGYGMTVSIFKAVVSLVLVLVANKTAKYFDEEAIF
ncbi:MAG: sugar ABC transporter permease [Firmicutes bacterium]|nr:sugar ABC transporter permease [Bacillota bacterium]